MLRSLPFHRLRGIKVLPRVSQVLRASPGLSLGPLIPIHVVFPSGRLVFKVHDHLQVLSAHNTQNAGPFPNRDCGLRLSGQKGGVGVGLRICIANKLPGDANAAGPRTTFDNH